MSKQDRVAVRTASELEQKYGWGKRFAEVMGIATDARSAADAAADAVNQFSKELTSEEIFNRLTENGAIQGIYRQDGQIYINATYIKSGELLADLIKAGVLQSKDGNTFYLDLDKGILRGKFTEFSVGGKTVDDISKGYADTAVNTFAETVTKDIEALQSQIDGQIQTWFYDYEPTTDNYPASEWTTTEQKNQHLGDLFYVVDNQANGGEVYRWSLINEVYKWQRVEDTEVAKALEMAAKAQDTADGKRRVFVTQPTPPYDVGDLWAQGANGDLMRCKTARTVGAYDAADWELASKYIDRETAESIAQGKVDGQTQEDIFNKLTNNGAVKGIYLENGELYINATYIKSGEFVADLLKTGILKSKNGTTFYLDLDKGILKGQFTEFSIAGQTVDEIVSRSETSTKNYAANEAYKAESNANEYAEQCANAAEGNANAYADGVAGTAEQNAKSHADTAAGQAESNAKAHANNAAAQAEANAKAHADKAAADAVKKQTQLDIFNKLTNNGTIQGMFLKDGEIYINAAVIQSLEQMFAKDITMTGKFECTSQTYLPPTYDDAIYTLRSVFFPDEYPLPSQYSFDLNGDGKFDEDDAILAMAVYNGEIAMRHCPGARKTTVTLRINMSDPEKIIHIYGYNMWGTYVETFISADANNCTFETRDYVRRIINQDPNSTTIYRTVDGWTEYINPPMEERCIYRTAERMFGEPVYTVVIPGAYTSVPGYQTIRTSGKFTVDGKEWTQIWMIKE